MKAKLGIFFVTLGIIFLVGALGLFSYNMYVQFNAEKATQELMPKLVEMINENIEPEENTTELDSFAPLNIVNEEMPTVEIDENGYIGFLSFPSLDLELPVMADWDMGKLKNSPCRYSGTLRGNDLVIMAHNYTIHFGKISGLNERDVVKFTDVNGNVTEYYVVLTDILAAVDIEEMTAGEYDLTLFTCNYDGRSRITIRLNKLIGN